MLSRRFVANIVESKASPANQAAKSTAVVKAVMGATVNADDTMRQIDALVAHVWMVRTFLKHCDELDEDDDLREVHRALYDFPLALGAAWKAQDAAAYLKQAKKKIGKLRKASELFAEIQPEVSTHTNFLMAVRSLNTAVASIEQTLADAAPQG